MSDKIFNGYVARYRYRSVNTDWEWQGWHYERNKNASSPTIYSSRRRAEAAVGVPVGFTRKIGYDEEWQIVRVAVSIDDEHLLS